MPDPTPKALDLAEIERYCEAATPGPWTTGHYGLHIAPAVKTPGSDSVAEAHFRDNNEEARANAAFIARSRRDLPLLVERVKRLEEALQDVIGTCEDNPCQPCEFAAIKARAALGEPR